MKRSQIPGLLELRGRRGPVQETLAATVAQEERKSAGELLGATKRGDAVLIRGVSSAFGVAYPIDDGWGDPFLETIDPAAADKTLGQIDVTSAFNHDRNYTLGRHSAKTLRSYTTADALNYETLASPASPNSATAIEAVRRGDAAGSSFAFVVEQQQWTFAKNGPDERLILEFHLFEHGPVIDPASIATGKPELNAALDYGTLEPSPTDERVTDARILSVAIAMRRNAALTPADLRLLITNRRDVLEACETLARNPRSEADQKRNAHRSAERLRLLLALKR